MTKLARRMGLAGGALLLLTVGVINGCGGDDNASGSSSGSTKDSGGNDTGSSGSSGTDSQPLPDVVQPPPDTGTTLTASSILASVDDAGTTGTAKFTELNGTVSVVLGIQNGAPGVHGMHVHNGTDCTTPGPHYGPDGGPYHGEWKITVNEAGVGALTVPVADITVSAGPVSVVGHAIVYHKLPAAPVDAGDDAGDAEAGPAPGPPPRQACGVITKP